MFTLMPCIVSLMSITRYLVWFLFCWFYKF